VAKKSKQKVKPRLNSGIKQTIVHWFVPHHSNKYHPHAIKWQSLVVTALISLSMHFIYTYTTTGQIAVLGRSITISSSQLLNLTNEQRQKNNLEGFTMNETLNRAAELKAKDMVENNYWSHVSPNGVSPWYWIDESGYKYQGAGENLAKNYADEASIVNAWMVSSAHRENILNSQYKEVGIAAAEDVIDGKITTIVVMYYVQPESAGVIGSSQSLGNVALGKTFVSINNPLIYLGSTLKNMSPVTLGVLSIIVMLGFVSLGAFVARSKLPKEVAQSWHKHHGLHKTAVLSIMVVLLLIFSSGVTL